MKKSVWILTCGLGMTAHGTVAAEWLFMNSLSHTTISSQDYMDIQGFTLPGLDNAKVSARFLGTLTGNVKIGWNPNAQFTVDYVRPTATFTPFQIQGLLANVSYSMSFNGSTILQQTSKLGEVLFEEYPPINSSAPTAYTLTHHQYTSDSGNSTFDDVYGQTHWEFWLQQNDSSLPGWHQGYVHTNGYRASSQDVALPGTVSDANFQVQVTTQTTAAQFAYAQGVIDPNGKLRNEIVLSGTVPAANFLQNRSDLSGGMTGVSVQYEYIPFASPSNPIMPSSSGSGGGAFSFNEAGTVLIGTNTFNGGFYDPDVAVGYVYEASDAATVFSKVMVPNDYGDGKFSLLVWDELTGEFIDTGVVLSKGIWFDFSSLGLTGDIKKFSIRGIEVTAYVDPLDPDAFVTGIVFGGTGHAFTMTAMTEFVEAPAHSVPEPETYALLLAGLGLVGLAARRHKV